MTIAVLIEAIGSVMPRVPGTGTKARDTLCWRQLTNLYRTIELDISTSLRNGCEVAYGLRFGGARPLGGPYAPLPFAGLPSPTRRRL